MKKFLSAFIALIIVLSLSGAVFAADKPVIGVLIYKYDDTYISTVRNAIEKYGADVLDITMQDGKGDQATQNDQVDVFIAKGVDAWALASARALSNWFLSAPIATCAT